MNDLHLLIGKELKWIEEKTGIFCDNFHDRQDLTSETVLKCLLYASTLKDRSKFKRWVMAVMRNTWVTMRQKRRNILFIPEPEKLISLEEDPWIAKEAIDALRKLRDTSVCIDAVFLYAMGYSHAEIARACQLPEATVRRRVCEGRRIIAKRFKSQ